MAASRIAQPPKVQDAGFNDWMWRLWKAVNNVANYVGVDYIDNIISVQAFKSGGEVFDGSMDNTTTINAAHAAANAFSGPVILVYPGNSTYRIDSASGTTALARSDITVIGDGAKIMVNDAAANGITFSGVYLNATVRGFIIDATTIGAVGIKFLQYGNMKVQNVTISNMTKGIEVATYQYPLLQQVVINDCATAIEANYGDGLSILQSRLSGQDSGSYVASSIGVKIIQGGGTTMVNTDIVRFDHGIDMQPAAATSALWTFLLGVNCDTCNYGLYAKSGSGTIEGIEAVNSWFSTCTSYGIYCESVNGATFTGCTIYNNASWGMDFYNSLNMRVNGCTVGWNNTGNAADTGGIFLQGNTQVYIDGNDITNASNGWNGSGTQKIGVYVTGSAQEDIHITNNHFAGHSGLDVNWPTAPTTRGTVAGNTTDKSNGVTDAATITPDLVFDTIHITGTGTTITNITSTQIPDKQLTIITDGTVTINHGNNFKLAGAANFAGTAGSYLTLVVNPTNSKWSERARSIM